MKLQIKEFHNAKNLLMADIMLLFNKQPELFSSLPDDLIERMSDFLKEAQSILKSNEDRKHHE